MIQNVLRHIGGIENYGILSICLFFACFLGVTAWALFLKKPYLDTMAAKPLDADPRNASETPDTPHE
jgi:hypothetical protein